MSACDDLLSKARQNAKGLRFSELCNLAVCFGWEFARTKGSHHIYKRPGEHVLMTFQDDRGQAKPYQVRQLLAAIEALTGEDDTQ